MKILFLYIFFTSGFFAPIMRPIQSEEQIQEWVRQIQSENQESQFNAQVSLLRASLIDPDKVRALLDFDQSDPKVRSRMVEVNQNTYIAPKLLKELNLPLSGERETPQITGNFNEIEIGKVIARNFGGSIILPKRSRLLLALLKEYLTFPDPNIQRIVIVAIGYLQDKTYCSEISKFIESTNRDLRHAAVFALGQLKDGWYLPVIQKCLNDSDVSIQVSAVKALEKIVPYNSPLSLLPMLRPLLKDAASEVKAAVIEVVGPGKRAEDPKSYLPFLKDPSPLVRATAVHSFGKRGEAEYLPFLIVLLDDNDPKVKAATIQALSLSQDKFMLSRSSIEKEALIAKLRIFLKDQNEEIVMEAVDYFVKLGDPTFLTDIFPLLENSSTNIRHRALRAISALGDDSILPTVRELLTDTNPEIRQTATTIIEFREKFGEQLAKKRGQEFAKGKLQEENFGLLSKIVQEITQGITSSNYQIRLSSIHSLNSLSKAQVEPFLPELKKSLQDPSPQIRMDAAVVLGRHRFKELEAEVGKLLNDPSFWVRSDAIKSLADMGSDTFKTKITRMIFEDSEQFVQESAVNQLDTMGDASLVPEMIHYLENPTLGARATILALAHFEEKVAIPIIAKYITHADISTKAAALDALGNLKAQTISAEIVPLLNDSNPFIQQNAIRTLVELEAKEYIPQIWSLMHDAQEKTVAAAALAIVKLGDRSYLPKFAELLNDSNPYTVKSAAWAMGMLGGQFWAPNERELVEKAKALWEEHRNDEEFLSLK